MAVLSSRTYSFSFYCSADHRDLHSFPTRRSSDLPADRAARAHRRAEALRPAGRPAPRRTDRGRPRSVRRSEEHTSELQSLRHLVCRLLLEKKKKTTIKYTLYTQNQS